MTRPYPSDCAALAALASQIQATISALATYLDALEEFHRTDNRLHHPRCPDDERVRLTADLERLRPIVSRPPIIGHEIRSRMSDIGQILARQVSGVAQAKGVLAELCEMERDIGRVMDAMPTDPAPPPSGTEAAASPAVAGSKADPLMRTIEILGRAVDQIRLVKFLADRAGREAELATIVKDHYKRQIVNKTNLATARKQAERTRDHLEAEKAPLRIQVAANNVRLIDADPVA